MRSIHEATSIRTKDIVRSGILVGMIAALPVGLSSDVSRNGLFAGAGHNLWQANFWIYTAITSLGALLAWSTPKGLFAWGSAKNISVLIPLVLIGTATSQVLIRLINNNFQGAIVNLLLFGILIGIFAIVSAWKRQSRKI